MMNTVEPFIGADLRTEADVLALVELGRGDASFTPRFLQLLDERHPVYAGIDSAAVTRIRGALLLALTQRALPDAALSFVLSELESAYDPWLTAVAAYALRRRPEPSSRYAGALIDALICIRGVDERVRLGSHGGYGDTGETTTATAEILRTLGWLGSCAGSAVTRLRQLEVELATDEARALLREAIVAIESDLRGPAEAAPEPSLIEARKRLPAELSAVCLQDQAGTKVRFADFFVRPALVVFFFTRCGNPAKCPATILKLGRLQARVAAEGLRMRTAAITYDPGYDTPERLTQYARSWGARTDEDHRFFRTIDDLGPLRAFFELGVSYGASSVNQHQLEAFVLDREATIVWAVRRKHWREDEIVAAAASLD
ncbi:MAG TPA: SCO family protein [Polyangiaceae bacterium]|nr:SCO family protein [Polyangiaceae bacterium]